MDYVDETIAGIRRSKLLRLCLVAALALLLLVPIVLFAKLVGERQSRRDTVTAEVASGWGSKQVITGPALVLPYTIHTSETAASGSQSERIRTHQGVFLPKALRTKGRIDVESRSRGIFAVPVYSLKVTVEGNFGPPSLQDLGIDPATVDWSRAHLAVGISDVRAIREQSAVTWNGRPTSFLPGTGDFHLL